MKKTVILFLIVILLGINTLFAKEYSDFATPSELIIKKQIFPNNWQKLNGPFGGQGYTIRFDPNNSNKIIVTDSFAGIHISEDGGLTWKESNSGIDARTGKSGDAIPVFVTTLDPNNPNRIWCGVKNAMGVFLSTDGGMIWQHKDNGLPGGSEVEIRGLAVKPGDSNVVFAAGDLEEIGPFTGQFQRTQGIVYRTKDGGENWEKVLDGGNLFKDVIIDPSSPDTVYVASGFFDRQELEKLEGIYKSTDGGDTWTQINSGVRNLYVVNIKFDPANPNKIWGTTGMINQFGTDVENEDGGVIVTTDGGISWQEVKRGRNKGGNQIYSALGISEANPNVVYVSGFGLFAKSTDGGMIWTETGFGPRGSNAGHPIDIAVDPNDENTVLVDSYIGGVFKSTNGGKTWTSNAFGYSGAETRGIAISPDGKNVYATSRSGIFLSEDKGINWLPVGIGDVGQDELESVAVHPTNSSTVLLGDGQNSKSSIFLSVDGGMSWKTVFMLFESDFPQIAAATDLTGTIVFTDIKWAKSNPDVTYASSVKQSLAHDSVDSIGWGVFKSIDGGMTWTNKQNGIPGFKNIWVIDIDPNNENIIYAATNDAGIIKSVDGGESWIQVNGGLGDVKSFFSISICPTNTDVVLAGSRDGQIFRTTNSGATWELVLNELPPDDNVVSIVFNPLGSTHEVYAGANVTGFYVSSDDGLTWEQFNDGLSIRELTDLTVAPSGDAVYVTTNGGGVYRLAKAGSNLSLTRKQVETPSNAGVDASNNFQTEDDDLIDEFGDIFGQGDTDDNPDTVFTEPPSSLEDIVSISGNTLSGIVFGGKTTKSSILISLLEDSGIDRIKVSIDSSFPSKLLKIAPKNFVLNSKRNSKEVRIVAKSSRTLNKVFKEDVPDTLILNVSGKAKNVSVTGEIEIPISVED